MINVNNINLQLGSKPIFHNASLTIFTKQKIGVIGDNGCGKSTLFALLRGELEVDAGEVNGTQHLEIGYVAQEIDALDTLALDYVQQGDRQLQSLQEALQAYEQAGDYETAAGIHAQLYDIDAYTAPARAAQLLNGLGFSNEELSKPVKAFSGGWRVRLSLARTLMSRSDLLLLDEPTNHLDLEAIIWLEKYLKYYPGTMLIISHDRDFLDATVDYIVHVENKSIKLYTGNYSTFEKTRAEQLALQQAMYEKQQKQVAHMMSYVNRFRYKASKAKQAQSRLKAIDRLEILSAVQADSVFQFEFKKPASCLNPLLSLRHVDIGYADRDILKDISLSIAPGDRIGLLGPNGAGKSTFIKSLAGLLAAKRGELNYGQGIKVGYYAQHQLEHLNASASPIEHLQKLDEYASEQKLRNFLGGFGFSGDMAFATIEKFSGGEKARLALALLVWQAPNFLLLDEPTNHLDLKVRNALTLALQSYEGALIIVSHDRYLLRTTVDDFWLVANQAVAAFEGDLDDYQKWLAENNRETKDSTENKVEPAKTTVKQEQQSKRELAQKIQKYEKQLSVLDDEIKTIEAMLADGEIYQKQDQSFIQAKVSRLTELKQKMTECEEQWLIAQQSLEIS